MQTPVPARLAALAPFAVSAIAALALAGTALSAQARPMTPTDLATMDRLGGAAVSPDGRLLVFTVTKTDAETGKREAGLWLRPMRGRAAEPQRIADLTGRGESDPAFSADGKRLYFLADGAAEEGRAATTQLWMVVIGEDGTAGEPVQASRLPAAIAGFKLSPAGGRVALWGDIARDCPTFGCQSVGNRALPGPGTGRVYDQLFVRHWDAWETPGNHSRVFAFALDADGMVAGNGTAMDGPADSGITGDSPTKPFGGGEEIAWAPDGSALIFTARLADRDEPRSTNTDLWLAQVKGGRPDNVTAANTATDTLPTASPDGRWLAWGAMARPGYESDRVVVQLFDIETGARRALTADWDRSVQSISWAADSGALYVTAQEVLDTPLFRIDLATGKAERLTAQGHVGQVHVLADGSVVFSRDDLNTPPDLWLRDARGRERRLTDINAARAAEIDPVSVERFSFTGAGGATVWGQIVKPQAAAAGGGAKLPLLLLVHGGPQGSFGNSWSTRWNPKVMAAAGYAVATIDFHGSTGYGQAFTDSINRDWGGKPLEDLKLGLAAIPQADAGIDTANACALGGSYGGYMMNWIAGNWPDGFKCLVNHAGVFDLRAMAFETEELWFDEWDHGGPWWERTDAERWNPVNHVTKWQTPMLVIHGEKDFRIPYSQSLAAFTALQRRGIPSRLLVYPDENHWVLKAKNSIQWYENVLGWTAQWLKGDGRTATPLDPPAN